METWIKGLIGKESGLAVITDMILESTGMEIMEEIKKGKEPEAASKTKTTVSYKKFVRKEKAVVIVDTVEGRKIMMPEKRIEIEKDTAIVDVKEQEIFIVILRGRGTGIVDMKKT